LGTASTVDELTERIVGKFRNVPEPTPLTVFVQEVSKGLEYRIILRGYNFPDDSTAARDTTIVVVPTAGAWAVSSASSVSECRRGVSGPGVCL
jgi:hypothetical protein